MKPITLKIILDTTDLKQAEKAGEDAGKSVVRGFEKGSKGLNQSQLAALQKVEAARERMRTADERKERLHQQRIELINQRSASRLSEIEARKQATIETARERAFQREQERIRKLEAQQRQSASNVSNAFRSVGGIATGLSIGAAVGVGNQALDAAKDFDKIRSALAGVTGSIDAANRKFAELSKVAQSSVGVTTRSATSLYATFAVLGTVSEENINKAITAMGRLTTVFDIDDQRAFARNIQQLFDQGFEKADIKEALGRVPIFNQLLQSAFGTSDPSKLRRLRDAGKLTNDQFVGGLMDAINKDPRLKNIPESIGSRFDKVKDRVMLALEPLGRQIADFLIPLFERMIPLAEDFGNNLNRAILDNKDEIARFRDSIVDLATAFKDLGNISIPIIGKMAQVAANGVGFWADVGNAIRGDFSFKNSQGNWGNLFGNDPDSRALRGSPFLNSPVRSIPGLKIDAVSNASRRTSAATETTGRGGRVPPRDLLSGAFVKTRYVFDLAQQQKAIDDHMSDLARGTIQQLDADRDERLRRGRLSRAALTQDFEEREEAAKAIEKARKELEKTEPVLTNAQRLMKGFGESVESTGDAFERLGSNIARSFNDVRTMLSSLGNAVKQFFNDLLGQSLQRLAGSVLAPIFGSIGGAVPGLATASAGGGIGNVFGSIGGAIGGNIFRTPSTFPSSTASPFTQSGSFLNLRNPFNPGGALNPNALPLPNIINAGVTNPAAKFSLSSIGKNIAAAAPFLGLSIGSSLGGTSRVGNILGGAGGLALGGFAAATLTPGLFSATAAGLLSNPITAIAGAALLVGGIFLGKAKQRREDEKLADSLWVQYMNTLDQLTRDVRANRLNGDDALAQAAVARQQAIDQISTIKTDSVRKSRLRNQIPDVDRLKLEPLKRAVEEQKRRKEFDSFLIPEFATGGRVPGRPSEKRLVMAHGEELIINSQQQTPELLMAAARAGVPGVKGSNNAGSSSQPNINITLVIGTEDQSQIFINGLQNNRATKSLRDTINSLVAHGEI